MAATYDLIVKNGDWRFSDGLGRPDCRCDRATCIAGCRRFPGPFQGTRADP